MTARHVVTDDAFGLVAKMGWELQRRVLKGTLDPNVAADALQQFLEGQQNEYPATIMTARHVVTDDAFGLVAKRGWELQRRVLEGTLDPNVVADALQQFLKGQQNEYPVTIDCNQFLADMITVGKYDWVNSDITAEHFLINGTGIVERSLLLIHFNRSLSSEAVLEEFDAQGWRPATIEELLAFGKTYPNKQQEFPIIGLGSAWRSLSGNRNVPYLGQTDSGRRLGLDWLDGVWGVHCRFLAVRKWGT